MTIVKPCSICSLRKHCQRFSSINWTFECAWIDLKRLTAEISCDWFDGLYSPGVRVSVHLHEYRRGPYEEEERWPEGYFKGTVITAPKKNKVVVWIDDEHADDVAHMIVKVPLSRLSFIPEPPVLTCSLCGRPDGKKNNKEWSCDECDKEDHHG